jgi:hypothetical protein
MILEISKAERKTLMESLEMNIEEMREFRDTNKDKPLIVHRALNEKIDEMNFLHTRVRDLKTS